MISPLAESPMATDMESQDQRRFREWTQTVPKRDNWLSGEPHLREMLTDPIVHLVMRRDNLAPADVWSAIDRARAALVGADDHPRDVA